MDRHDGSFIVRYKMFQYCDDMEIHITWQNIHIAKSPYKFNKRILDDSCNCPLSSIDEMISHYECSENIDQIDQDLKLFQYVNFDEVLAEALKRFNHAGSYSFCHYAILNNKVRKYIVFYFSQETTVCKEYLKVTFSNYRYIDGVMDSM